MATDSVTTGQRGPVNFVAAEPMRAPPGYGAGTLAASRDFKVVALVLTTKLEPALRMLMRPADAETLGRQLVAAAGKLGGGDA